MLPAIKTTIALKPLRLVPMAGVEPARVSSLPPQDSVSTNSTTSAMHDLLYYLGGTGSSIRVLEVLEVLASALGSD